MPKTFEFSRGGVANLTDGRGNFRGRCRKIRTSDAGGRAVWEIVELAQIRGVRCR